MHIIPRLRPLGRAGRSVGVPALAALVLSVAALVLSPAAAFAHDALEASEPASGATVATAPAEVRLDLSNRPLGVGAEVRVTDASGTSWSDGAPQVVDRAVTQKLRTGAPAGPYTVVWRVVSSDSHPIEGTFGFTVAQGSTTAAGAPGASTSPTAQGEAIRTPEPGVTAAPTPAPAAQSQDFPWMIVVFALVAVGLLAALGVGARRRLARGEDEDD
jgi:methionine-rich copper-binding protein CopC